jgi:hypothetical protein
MLPDRDAPSMKSSLALPCAVLLALAGCSRQPGQVGGGPAAPATIVGRCVDEEQRPLAGVTFLNHGRPVEAVVSGADGRFRIDGSYDPHLARAQIRLDAEKPGFDFDERTLEVPVHEVTDLGDLVLRRKP